MHRGKYCSILHVGNFNPMLRRSVQADNLTCKCVNFSKYVITLWQGICRHPSKETLSAKQDAGAEVRDMTRTVTVEEVRHVLEGRLGRELVCSDSFSETIARALSTWVYSIRDLDGFAQRLEDLLLRSCFTVLGKSMRYRAHTGEIYQITLNDLPELTDRCLALLLPKFPASSASLETLQDLAFRKGSYAAMLTLYRNYAEHLGRANLSIIEAMMNNRVQTEGLPAELYPHPD